MQMLHSGIEASKIVRSQQLPILNFNSAERAANGTDAIRQRAARTE